MGTLAVLANLFYESYQTEQGMRTVLHAMPLLLGVLCVFAIAYRYYSAFLAAKVMALDDRRITPAHRQRDGQNFDPTNKWVLFGHHFAAISGAGPLIGPVLAVQYGYVPSLLWLVIGVCLAGAVQDMLVLAASVRRGGKSLAEIARTELGRWPAIVTSVAILFIVIIALAGLGIVVVKALGGEEVKLASDVRIILPAGSAIVPAPEKNAGSYTAYRFPEGCQILYGEQATTAKRPESFLIGVPNGAAPTVAAGHATLPAGSVQIVPGSSWGTFTIACTIPIALFIGVYLVRLRPGRVVEASIIGAVAVLAATIVGRWIPGSALEPYFSLTRGQTILALTGYGFVASVLPVWLLLCPRDYLSSFLKIGTIALLVVGVLVANPALHGETITSVFREGSPVFPRGAIFPFVFICIMCGAISGFHALVSSGTTPKMIDRESHIRPIGYGAMLMESLVGVMALIAAASLDPHLYYGINVELDKVANYQDKLQTLYAAHDPLHRVGVDAVQHLDLAQAEQLVGGESLRGRTGGAVTLAVGMADIFTRALRNVGLHLEGIMQYWYHFAIMFEALFILTTIDAGTRIGRFLLQETLGKLHPRLGRPDWMPGAVLATLAVTAGWGLLIQTGSISTIWPMFGIANQLLAVVALALVTTLLVNTGRGRYAWVTILPMLFVTATTMTAGAQMVGSWFPAMIRSGQVLKGWLNILFSVFVIACVLMLLLMAVSRWLAVWSGLVPARSVVEVETEQRTEEPVGSA